MDLWRALPRGLLLGKGSLGAVDALSPLGPFARGRAALEGMPASIPMATSPEEVRTTLEKAIGNPGAKVERLEQTPIWLFEWLRQQHDGPYWRQGSLAPHWDRLTTPTFLIGGWMDEYVDAALRMLERCVNARRRALIGNWVHDLPDDAYPGPNVDWYHEMVRFFDRWLKGIDNGVMDEPGLVAFRHDWAEPEPFPAAWSGEWIAEASWPPADLGQRVLHLAPGQVPLVGVLSADPPSGAAVERFRHRATIGTRAGLSWGAGGRPNGVARDLRPDDRDHGTCYKDPDRRTTYDSGQGPSLTT